MKKFFIVLFLVLLSANIFATQTITDLNTNSPIPLDKTFTVTGNYSDTDSNSSVFCKFLILDSDNKIVERLSDERTFPNGDFYSQRTLNEPLYKRGQDYNVLVDCETASDSILFSLEQRESIGHTAEYETRFAFDRGNLDSMLFFGGLIFAIIIIFTIFIFWFNRAKKGVW